MSEYTPTEFELRQTWVSTYASSDGTVSPAAVVRGQEEFDRFLARRDARVRAEAIQRVMPEDVRELMEKARTAAAFWTEAPQKLLHQLADALAAAYSQEGADDGSR